MTFDQLTEAVTRLGFEDGAISRPTLLAAANRAVETIFSDRPMTRSVRFDIYKPTVTGSAAELRHTGGGSESLPLKGRSFIFRASDGGEYILSDGAVELRGSFGRGETVRGRMREGGSITFLGEKPYYIRGLTAYLEDYPEGEIPERRPFREHELWKRIGDLAAFVALPTDSRGRYIPGASLRDGVLTLPFDYSGEVELIYKRRAPVISGMGDEEIDIPPDTLAALPLLTAAFTWLDDDPDKAQYYMALYREIMADLRRYSARTAGAKYETDGWA